MTLVCALLLVALVFPARAQGTLDISLIDVADGNTRLFVAPVKLLLIDTGNGSDNAARDARRIVAAARVASLDAIDRLILTHYHGDHYGATEALATLIPICEYLDYGSSVQDPNAFLEEVSPALYGPASHWVVARATRFPSVGPRHALL